MFETEYEFTLPRGYKDPQGELHRDGVMRLATAADEILPLGGAQRRRRESPDTDAADESDNWEAFA